MATPEVRQAKRRQEEARQEDTGQEGRRKEEVRPEEARQEKTRQRKRQEETREDKGDSVPERAILRKLTKCLSKPRRPRALDPVPTCFSCKRSLETAKVEVQHSQNVMKQMYTIKLS